MSEQIEWQPGAKFIHLVCRLGLARADAEDPDAMPDLMTQGGMVKLSCSVNRIRYSEADGRRRMLTVATPWTYTIRDSDGELVNTSTGQIGENILSGASTGTDPGGFWWTAEVFPASGGSFKSVIPPLEHGTVFDLVDGTDDVLPPGTLTSTVSARMASLEQTMETIQAGAVDPAVIEAAVESQLAGVLSAGGSIFLGEAAPPDLVVGAMVGDVYVNTTTGDLYQLQTGA